MHLESILYSLPIAKAMGKTREKFLGMERDLAKELLRLWRETCAAALKEIFHDLPAFTSKEAMELLRQSLADLLGPAFGNSPEMQSLMKWGVKRAYRAAKSEFLMPTPEKGKASPTLSLPDHRAINVLTRHNCFWLGQRYGNAIRPKIAKLTQAALDEGLGRDALAELLRQGLGEAAPGGYTYWDVVASAAIVRARSFGALSGMEEAGITEYEILAMGDERMCPICGEMNGRTFSVAKTREVVNRVLDITDPEKFKAAMPWQTKTPKGKSNADLLASGQSLPPFHGRCRCTLVVVAESEPDLPPLAKTIEEANEIAVKYGIAKKADFSGLDVSAANELIQGVYNNKQMFPEIETFGMVASCQTYERLRASLLTGARVAPVDERTFAFETTRAAGNLEPLKGVYLNADKFSPERIAKTITETLPQAIIDQKTPVGCDTTKSIIDHEMGHVIDRLLKAASDKELKALFGQMKKTMSMEDELSSYARDNVREFIAEGWSEYLNNPEPRPVAKRIGERLIELRDKKREEARKQ